MGGGFGVGKSSGAADGRPRVPASWGKQSQRILVEGNLLTRLLQLSDLEDPEQLLTQALALAVDAVGARRGFLGIFPRVMRAGDPPRWWKAVGFSDREMVEIQSKLSTTIIEDVLSNKKALVIPSAMGHQKYSAQESVLLNNILSVACAPVGTEGRGILYLQERTGGGVFGREEEGFVSDLGRHLGPVMDRLALRADLNAPTDPTLPWRDGGRFTGIIGATESIARAMELVTRFAPLSEPVLFLGPSGVGKQTLARELHEQSHRSGQPFVHVPCGALPAAQAVAELFGQRSGLGPTGFVHEASRGTLFLDGVDLLPLDAQAAVLALLERGPWRAGADASNGMPDVRIVASANASAAELAGAKRLASDLYHRLSTLRVAVPGLAERSDDVPRLLEHYGRLAAARNQVPWRGIDPDAAIWARTRPWPGNVRELETIVARAVVGSEGRRSVNRGDLVVPDEVTLDDVDLGEGFGEDWVRLYLPDGDLKPWDEAVRSFKRTYLELALDRHEGNRTRTAAAIGLSKSRMFAVIKELGLGSSERDD